MKDPNSDIYSFTCHSCFQEQQDWGLDDSGNAMQPCRVPESRKGRNVEIERCNVEGTGGHHIDIKQG